MKKVAIAASEQTRHERRRPDKNVEDLIYETVSGLIYETVSGLIYETVSGLLAKSGLSISDIDTVIGAGDDVLDGRSISNVFTAEYAGAFLKEESKVEDDGAFAAAYAFMRIASGAFDTAVVYAYGKASDSSPQHYSGTMADPFFLRPLGVEAITAAALQAQCYYRRFGVTEHQAARVAVKNRRNAIANPSRRLKATTPSKT